MDTEGGREAPGDFLLLDLAQDLWPDADRDHGGEHLGLFYYDFQVRPPSPWLGLGEFAYAIYGDHDWQTGLRTLDTEVRFGRGSGLEWSLDYRRDAVVEGAVGAGVRAALLGRWDLQASVQYDFDRGDYLKYGVGVVRADHDWSLLTSVTYDPYEDQLSFRLEFLPRFLGRARPRSQDWFADPVEADRFKVIR
jgi:hypothetical protein